MTAKVAPPTTSIPLFPPHRAATPGWRQESSFAGSIHRGSRR
ncbi:MAG: hypothetical protein AVDCRST_MAG10-3644 [uncultured Acidimicrobiales bacterium]|uniref:Uncharacterized protein n=1 Tax=uncultured Acidimicrobiales bacterium TaxID=310071 RepID=A0A6J4JD24_9ACTN|nr:MAG: hypothetical protein AVDCRST_MAG10-3644 [uncultured Acidimicrobiales bacterium]